jgi:hypothetical protein
MVMEWISVKESLPDKYERVLVTDGKYTCMHYKQSACNYEGSEGDDLYGNWCYQWRDGCYLADGNVTHWIPLPQPPKD